jgi:uncharacterized protein with ParB-like and HNH nuclease domain
VEFAAIVLYESCNLTCNLTNGAPVNDDLQTISKMFTEKLFRIPDYQRGYAWTQDQLEDFWSDLRQIGDEGNHYTGVLTLETVPKATVDSWEEDQWIIKSKGFDPYYVVDGQQRLTTSIILVTCIAETLTTDTDVLNYTSKTEIEKKFLFDSKNGGASRSYIFGYEKDNPSYEYLKTEIFSEKSATDRKEETVYTNNLLFAKTFFEGKISELEKGEVEDLYIKVTQHLLFNIFTISEEVDVCVAFETMNNRGKPLSHLELLKNRLIYLTTRVEVDDHEAKDLRRTINDSWKTVYHNLGRNKKSPLDDDFFLRSHHLLNFIEPASNKYETEEDRRKHRRLAQAANEPVYKNLLNDIFTFSSILEDRKDSANADIEAVKRIHDYSISLQDAVKMWYHIFNPEPCLDPENYNFWLAKINRISAPSTYPILLAVMLSTSSNDKRTDAFKTLERSLFIDRLSTGYRRYDPTTVKTLSAAIRLVNGEIEVDEFIESLKSDADYTANSKYHQKEIRDAMKRKNYYSWRATHYLLYEYNLHLQLESKTSREKIIWDSFVEQETDYASIEHIYPQTARAKYWTERFKGLTSAKRDLLKNVIGNLVPLSKPKNSSLSNKAFPEKVSSDTSKVGFAYGSYAENEIATQYKDWTPQAILDRSLHLLDFVENRWGITFGRESEKIEMLGLGFVKPSIRIHPRRIGSSDTKASSSNVRKKKP